MKRNMIIIAVLAATVMLTGCGKANTGELGKTAAQPISIVDAASQTKEQSSDSQNDTSESENTDSDFSSKEYYPVEEPPASSVSVAALDGTWHCTTSDASLWFTRDEDIYKGTWHDNLEEGDVRFEYSEDENGVRTYWFNLYNNRNELWYSIYAAGEIPFDEFVVKNDDGEDFHYIRQD